MPFVHRSDIEKYIPKKLIDSKIKYGNSLYLPTKLGTALYLPKKRDGDGFSDILNNIKAVAEASKNVAEASTAAVNLLKTVQKKKQDITPEALNNILDAREEKKGGNFHYLDN